MIFETKAGRYWPIDHSAEIELVSRGFVAPLDWQSYEALVVFMREAGREAPEVWDRENPFCLEHPEKELTKPLLVSKVETQ